mmetsp:Transcript_158946/g.509909  ORF Transcript_158946/g.509909 Transcript_158946/m.509909 type:complete len:219 (+) Transcript_158946:724-1380(+)
MVGIPGLQCSLVLDLAAEMAWSVRVHLHGVQLGRDEGRSSDTALSELVPDLLHQRVQLSLGLQDAFSPVWNLRRHHRAGVGCTENDGPSPEPRPAVLNVPVRRSQDLGRRSLLVLALLERSGREALHSHDTRVLMQPVRAIAKRLAVVQDGLHDHLAVVPQLRRGELQGQAIALHRGHDRLVVRAQLQRSGLQGEAIAPHRRHDHVRIRLHRGGDPAQ